MSGRRLGHAVGGTAMALLLALGSVGSASAAVTWNAVVRVTKADCAWSTPGAFVTFGTSGTLLAYQSSDCESPDRIFVRRRTETGVSTQLLSGTKGSVYAPSLGSWNRKIDAVWGSSGHVRYRHSDNAGATWSETLTLSGLPEWAGPPRVTRDGDGRVAVVWIDYNAGHLRVAVSTNGGLTFRRHTLATIDDDAIPESPSVAIADGAIVVAYSQFNSRVFVRRSTDDGTNWSPRASIATYQNNGYTFASASGSTVIVGTTRYVPTSGRTRVVTIRSPDAGLAWDSIPIEERGTMSSDALAFTAASGVWRTVYAQCKDSTCTGTRLVYRESVDDGMTWSPRSIAAGKRQFNSPVGVGALSGNPIVAWVGAEFNGGPHLYMRTGVGSP
jgi:hypothetical protein